MNLDKPLYPIEEVAEITGFGLRPLIEDCRKGRVERVYRDRKHWMTPAQIEALLKQHTRPAVTSKTKRSEADADERNRRRGERALRS